MKTAVTLLLFCSVVGAQDSKTDTIKRLESVTWDLSTHKLVWLVGKGTVVDGEFVTSSQVKYEVSPDEFFMTVAGEKRAVREDEAVALHQLLDTLSLYCVGNVVRWDKGDKNEPDSPVTQSPGVVTKPEKPAQPKSPAAPDGKPVKVGDQEHKQPSNVREKELVAAKGQ
jgi:hypothetical protein